MTQVEIREIEKGYSNLTKQNQAVFLALLCFHITEIGRSTYPEIRQGSRAAIEALTDCNELAHRVSSQLISTLAQREPAYPVDTFLTFLVEHTQATALATGLAWSISKAWEHFEMYRGSLIED